QRRMMRPLGEREGERALAPIDQEVADVVLAAIGLRRRQLDRLLRDRTLLELAASREPLDDVAIAIARRKLHLRVAAGRIAAQHVIDDRQILDELAPVDRVERAQARDAVADRDLIRGLALDRHLEHALDGLALRLE